MARNYALINKETLAFICEKKRAGHEYISHRKQNSKLIELKNRFLHLILRFLLFGRLNQLRPAFISHLQGTIWRRKIYQLKRYLRSLIGAHFRARLPKKIAHGTSQCMISS